MISPETLRRFKFFANIEPDVLKDIAMTGTTITCGKGDWVFYERTDADALYLVERGSIELMINLDETGEKQAYVSTVVDGEIMGWSALVDPYTFTLGAVCRSEASLVRLDANKLRDLMDEDCDLRAGIMTGLASAMAERLSNLRVQFVSITVA